MFAIAALEAVFKKSLPSNLTTGLEFNIPVLYIGFLPESDCVASKPLLELSVHVVTRSPSLSPVIASALSQSERPETSSGVVAWAFGAKPKKQTKRTTMKATIALVFRERERE